MVLFSFIYEMTDIIDKNTTGAQFGYSISLLFGMLTPSLNPILYSLFNENVKKHLQEKCGFFRCVGNANTASEEVEGQEMKTLEANKSNGTISNEDSTEGKLLVPSTTNEVVSSASTNV